MIGFTLKYIKLW